VSLALLGLALAACVALFARAIVRLLAWPPRRDERREIVTAAASALAAHVLSWGLAVTLWPVT
jgi:hypothetical protein